MNLLFPFLVSLLILGATVFLAWRLISRRRELPCPAWLGWMVEMDNPFTKTNRAHTIIEHLDLQPGMKALDFGCGPGRVTVPMAERVGAAGEVTAVDLQAGMLERAQAKAREKSLTNIRFVQAAAGDGKLGGNQFDRATLVTVLGEIPDQATAMKELFEALNPGGLLSVTEVIFDPHFQRRSTVTRLAQSAGFQEKDFFGNSLAYTLNLVKPEA
jgi:ubiquinone/menaquinone biosynthesis C-methylase UbiE